MTKETIEKTFEIYGLKELTAAQKLALSESTTNLWQMPNYYCDDALVFKRKSAFKHWQYYAGFEYLDEERIETIKRGEDFVCVVSGSDDGDDRVKYYLDILKDTEKQ